MDRRDPIAQDTEHPAETDEAGDPGAIDAPKVSDWFAGNIPGATPPLQFQLIAGGRSNLTYRVDDAAGHAFVLRRPPLGHLLPTAHDMAREHKIISSVAPAGVPVAPALGLCEDPGVNGAPFYVMGFVEGYILRDARAAAFDEAGRRRAAESLIETLAKIHSVEPDAVGLGDLGKREGYIARQLKRWYAQYQSSRNDSHGEEVPDVGVIHDRLAAMIPEQGPAAVVHGDYRLDNTVVATDATIAAVLDWELCTLGDPLADVGQLLAYWTEPGEASPAGASPTTAAGFPRRQEVLALYSAASGRDLGRIDFYLAFAYWKLACILEGVYTRHVAGGGYPDSDFSRYPQAIAGLLSLARDALG
jgi:aminoglycoside phosphotransferase (APT) family kinase protein